MRVSNSCEFSCISFHGSIEKQVASEDLAIRWIILFRLHDSDDFSGKSGCYVSSEDWLVPIAGTGGLRVLACGGFSASFLGNQLPLSILLYVLLQRSSFQIQPGPRQNDHCCFIS